VGAILCGLALLASPLAVVSWALLCCGVVG